MGDILWPDYSNCILNTTASLLSHYGVETAYKTLPVLDKLLSGNYKNVILMVFDGIGVNAIEDSLPEDSFLRKNIKHTLTSVYPSTTTAAMTAYYSGLSPNEHGWLGWSLFFKEYCRTIDLFTNRDSFTNATVGDTIAADTLMPYKTIFEQIHSASDGEVKTHAIVPYGISFPSSPNTLCRAENVSHICDQISSIARSGERKLIFSYWPEPDSTMHKKGSGSDEAIGQLRLIDDKLKSLCGSLKDSVVIVSADHGHINITENILLNEIPEINECLLIPPTVEPRALSFYIRPEMKQVFAERFNRRFSDSFILMTKDDVFEKRLLGYGVPHSKTPEFIGDFLACATGTVMMQYKTMNNEKKDEFKSAHAGLTVDEMLVPLIVCTKEL